MSWTLFAAASVNRFLSKLDAALARRLTVEMGKLQDGPFPFGYKKLKGGVAAYRLRVGDYRVLYEVDAKSKTIRVYSVEHRSRAYR